MSISVHSIFPLFEDENTSKSQTYWSSSLHHVDVTLDGMVEKILGLVTEV